MADSLFSFLDSPGSWIFWGLSIFVVSALMLIEVEHRQTAHRRRDVWRTIVNAMCVGVRSGMRGYFAPFHKAPWRAAWRAYRDPAGRWWSPLAAWMEASARITFGSK